MFRREEKIQEASNNTTSWLAGSAGFLALLSASWWLTKQKARASHFRLMRNPSWSKQAGNIAHDIMDRLPSLPSRDGDYRKRNFVLGCLLGTASSIAAMFLTPNSRKELKNKLSKGYRQAKAATASVSAQGAQPKRASAPRRKAASKAASSR